MGSAKEAAALHGPSASEVAAAHDPSKLARELEAQRTAFNDPGAELRKNLQAGSDAMRRLREPSEALRRMVEQNEATKAAMRGLFGPQQPADFTPPVSYTIPAVASPAKKSTPPEGKDLVGTKVVARIPKADGSVVEMSGTVIVFFWRLLFDGVVAETVVVEFENGWIYYAGPEELRPE
jgi:hypothetical protein